MRPRAEGEEWRGASHKPRQLSADLGAVAAESETQMGKTRAEDSTPVQGEDRGLQGQRHPSELLALAA